jgi:hypothetical protein
LLCRQPFKNGCLDFWNVIQGLDDWRDNDPVDAKEKERVIYQVMVELPQNHSSRLSLTTFCPLPATSF